MLFLQLVERTFTPPKHFELRYCDLATLGSFSNPPFVNIGQY